MGHSCHPWLDPLSFRDGSSLPIRILPGPMEGVSEGSFLPVMSGSGFVKAWFTPFIRISNGVPRNARLREKLSPYLETGLPVIAQIMGTHIELLAEASARLHRLGATVVDINCACPSQQVLSSKSGGYHLTDPQWLHDAVIAMKQASGLHPVSIKIRCGFQSPDEIPDIAAALREAAPDLVTCHFRTVQEAYHPVENPLPRLVQMHELLGDIPFFASGDLFTLEDARRMYQIVAPDGIAPARGLLKNPALLREIEADCKGLPPENALTTADKIAFLNQIGTLSHTKRHDQGFVLKIAKVMFGENTPDFQNVMEAIQRGEYRPSNQHE